MSKMYTLNYILKGHINVFDPSDILQGLLLEVLSNSVRCLIVKSVAIVARTVKNERWIGGRQTCPRHPIPRVPPWIDGEGLGKIGCQLGCHRGWFSCDFPKSFGKVVCRSFEFTHLWAFSLSPRSGIETRLQNAVFHLLRTQAPAQWVIHSQQTRQQEPLVYMLKIQVLTFKWLKGIFLFKSHNNFRPSGKGEFWKASTPCAANWAFA